jgi:hypothetical protein
MEVFQPFRDIKQLSCKSEIKLAVCCNFCVDESLPHQRRPRCLGVFLYVLADIAVFRPVINEGSRQKDCCVHTAKGQDIIMG